MAKGNAANFKGKRAAPFVKGGTRKHNSANTAKGTIRKKKGKIPPGLAAYLAKKKKK